MLRRRRAFSGDSSRNCIAPHEIGVTVCRRNRWTMTGMHPRTLAKRMEDIRNMAGLVKSLNR
jgi:hypothetical protein